MKFNCFQNQFEMTENIEAAFNLMKSERADPFEKLKISSNEFLQRIEERSPCPKCNKSRKFFCYTCYVPVISDKDGVLPNVEVYNNCKPNETTQLNKRFFFLNRFISCQSQLISSNIKAKLMVKVRQPMQQYCLQIM